MSAQLSISTSALVACAVLAVAATGHAQSAAAQAETLFRVGVRNVNAGRFAEACAAFEASRRLVSRIPTLFNLASCREQLGQLATAWQLFLEVERRTQAATGDEARQLHHGAVQGVTRLQQRIPVLTIRVPDDRKVQGLEILRGTERVPEDSWNQPLPVDGGTYTITARAPGMHEWTTTVTLAAAASARIVEIPALWRPEMPPPSPLPPPPPSPPPPPAIPAPTSMARSIALPIAIGAGAVALLGGALGASRWGGSAYDQATAETLDQARRDALYESANHRRYLAEGLAIAGVGCAGLSAWLYLRPDPARTESELTWTARLRLVPAPSGISLAGQF